MFILMSSRIILLGMTYY